MSEIDHINSHIVPLHSDTQFLEVSFVLLQRMTNENNHSLSLALVLSMLETELPYLDSIEEVSLSICQFNNLVNN